MAWSNGPSKITPYLQFRNHSNAMWCNVLENYLKSSFIAALIGQLYPITWSFAESYSRAMSEQLKNDVLKVPSLQFDMKSKH